MMGFVLRLPRVSGHICPTSRSKNMDGPYALLKKTRWTNLSYRKLVDVLVSCLTREKEAFNYSTIS